MDDKERLRLAKEALDSGSYDKETIEYIFPELREESENERIVKELLTFFRESIHGGHILTNKEYDSWIAWLEKYGDRKPTWSKEDEDYYDAIIAKLEVTQDDALLTDNQMEFLKSLKDRFC